MSVGRVDVLVVVDTGVLQNTVPLPPGFYSAPTLGQVSKTIWLLDVEGWESHVTGRYIHPGILLKDTQLYLYTVYPQHVIFLLLSFLGIDTVYMYSILDFF